MDKPNRAERRKNKFGSGRATAHGGWPTVEPNPVFDADADADADGAETVPEPAAEPKAKPSAKMKRAAEPAKRAEPGSGPALDVTVDQ